MSFIDESSNDSPGKLFSGAFVSTKKGIFQFGGCDDATTYSTYNDVELYDPKTDRWIVYSTTLPRCGHTATLVSDNIVIIIGGYGNNKYLSDTLSYDISALSNAITTRSNSLSARSGHTAVFQSSSQSIFLIGGGTDNSVFSDVRKFSVSTNQWTLLSISSGTFPARWCHSAVMDPSEQKIFVAGGSDSKNFNSPSIVDDLWVLDLTSSSWSNIASSGYSFCGHTSHWFGDKVYFFFGRSSSSSSYSSNVFYYNPSNGVKSQLTFSNNINPSRAYHSSALDYTSNILYIFGGLKSSTSELSDFWTLDMRAFTLSPTRSPTNTPSLSPTRSPTNIPSFSPTRSPTAPTLSPSEVPTISPSYSPTVVPTSEPSFSPSANPTFVPTNEPSLNPTSSPSQAPSQIPSREPTASPSLSPSFEPTVVPTLLPTVSHMPSNDPSSFPTNSPSSLEPTADPSTSPSFSSNAPTQLPTLNPVEFPSNQPISTFPPSQLPSSSQPSSNIPTFSFSSTQNPSTSSFRPTLVNSLTPIGSSASTSNSTLLIGAILGAIIGALIILLCFGFCFWNRRSKKDRIESIQLSHKNPLTDLEMVSFENNFQQVNPSHFMSSSILRNEDYVKWEDIKIDFSAGSYLVGRGSFGSVIRAKWARKGITREVAIKVLERRFGDTNEQYQLAVEQAKQELLTLRYAESLVDDDCIVKAYGLAKGIMSRQLQDIFGSTLETVGIVMRFEAGGNLADYLHGSSKMMSSTLAIKEKVFLLLGISRALSELHAVSIIHGDIKPENVLLKSLDKPEVRLADFGLSTVAENIGVNASTLRQTKHVKGTLLYCAPEMVYDPRNNAPASSLSVAKPSRKTDIYAFGILSWEVMTQLRPFTDVVSEVELSKLLHDGERPPLFQLPGATPQGIIEMITKAWAQKRSERISAIECYSTACFNAEILSQNSFDIFLSHAWASKPLLSHVYRELTKQGYRVWYDKENMGNDLIDSMIQGIANSKIVLACVNSVYQGRENCLFELRQASKANKNIISLVLEKDPFEWASDELTKLCDLRSKKFVDISCVSNLTWESEIGGTKEMVEQLKEEMKPLLGILKEAGCSGSLLTQKSMKMDVFTL